MAFDLLVAPNHIRHIVGPGDHSLEINQVLIRVHAASVNALDYRRFEKTSIMGRLMDEVFVKAVGKVLGADIAGQVEVVGATATRLQPGDEVFGVSAGLVGAFAEYACAAEDELALKPPHVSFEAAAAVPVAASTALKCETAPGGARSAHSKRLYAATCTGASNPPFPLQKAENGLSKRRPSGPVSRKFGGSAVANSIRLNVPSRER